MFKYTIKIEIFTPILSWYYRIKISEEDLVFLTFQYKIMYKKIWRLILFFDYIFNRS